MRTFGMGMAVAMLLPHAAWSAADCATLQSTTATNARTLKTADVVECIHRGWDPPPDFIPDAGNGNKGANAGGSGGFEMGVIAAPENPPKTAGAPSSVSNSVLNFNLQFNINLSALLGGSKSSGSGGSATAGSASDAASSCPILTDTTGAYGALTSLPQTASLSCGGAVPLTNYRITLVSNPSGLMVTELNNPYVWLYRAGSSNYALIGSGASPFPHYLCETYTDAYGATHRRRAAVPQNIPATGFAPQAQMVMYNAATQSLAVRLVHSTPDDASNPFDPADQNEYFLVLPIRGGVPYVPLDDSHGDQCDLLSDFYKPYSALQGSSLSADMVIESSLVPGCEESAAVCSAAGQSQSPSTPASCTTTSYYPSGTSAGGTTCTGKIQYMVMDHPNLLFPPSATVNAVPVAQRTSSIVSTTSGSATDHTRLIGPADMVVHLNRSANAFTFSGGGTLGLANGSQLMMNGPATVDMRALQVTLPNGGGIKDASGSPVTSYADGAVVAIDPSLLPITLQAGEEIVMPDGYAILTEPAASVREPITPPK